MHCFVSTQAEIMIRTQYNTLCFATIRLKWETAFTPTISSTNFHMSNHSQGLRKLIGYFAAYDHIQRFFKVKFHAICIWPVDDIVKEAFLIHFDLKQQVHQQHYCVLQVLN